MRNFTETTNLCGRVALITGGNSGKNLNYKTYYMEVCNSSIATTLFS